MGQGLGLRVRLEVGALLRGLAGHRLNREANLAKKEQMGRKEEESKELKSSSFKTVKMRI